jgi:succinoglycan biosynthesis protein ExoM
MLISVCVCTYRRLDMLSALLTALGNQSLGSEIHDVQVVVVDNDPGHSAQPVLTAWQPPRGFTLVFKHVPVPNIAVARNMAVQSATGEIIAFIDDDETPCSEWLQQLWMTMQCCHADAVFGPVIPVYPPTIAAWLKTGRFFDRSRFTTGTPIDERNARTSNVLLRSQCLKTLEGPFDATFGRTGGEDSLLFRDLLSRHCAFVWCDEAPVYEVVTPDRASAVWLLRRSFRIGQTWIRAELYRLPRQQARVHRLRLSIKAAIQLVVSLGLVLLMLPVSRIKAFHWARTAAAQAGKLTGMSRFQYQEYGN